MSTFGDKLRDKFKNLVKKQTPAEKEAEEREQRKKKEDDDLAAAVAASLASAQSENGGGTTAGAAATTATAPDPVPKKSLFAFLDSKKPDPPAAAPNASAKPATAESTASPPPKPKAAVSYDAVKLHLVGGATHLTEIVARGYPTGSSTGNYSFKWYRATAGGQFDSIDGASESKYSPTIADIGARICCQWVPADGFPSNFAEWGPVKLDPAIISESTQLLATGHITVSGGGSASDRKSYNLLIDRERILLESLPSGDVADKFDVAADTRIRIVDSKQSSAGFAFTLESKRVGAVTATATVPDGGAAAAYGAIAAAPTTAAGATAAHKQSTFTGFCETSRQRDVLVYLIRHLCEEAEEAGDIVAVTIELAGEASEKGRRLNETQLRRELLLAQQESATSRSEANSARKKLAHATSERDAAVDKLKAAVESRKQSDAVYEMKVNTLVAEKANWSSEATSNTSANATKLKEAEIARNSALDDVEHLKKTLRTLTEQLATVSQRDNASKFLVDSMTKENKAIKDEQSKYNAEMAALRGELAVFKAQCRDLTANGESARKQVTELDERLKKMTLSESEARGELTNAKFTLAKSVQQQKDLDSLQRENERLSQELHQATTKLTLEKELTAHLTSKTESAAEDKKQADKEIAEIAKLRDQLATQSAELAECRKQLESGAAARTELQAQLNEHTATIAARDATVLTLTESVSNLQPKLADAMKSADDMLGQRNHWKRKADSLQQQVSQLLTKLDAKPASATAAAAASTATAVAPLDRGGSANNLTAPAIVTSGGANGHSPTAGVPSTPPPKGSKTSRSNSRADADAVAIDGGSPAVGAASMDERIIRLEREKKEALAAVDAYRRAFDQQLAKNKTVHQSALLAASNHAASGQPDGYFVQYQEMKKLANTLSETISDKDLALSHSKTINRELGKRIQELEQLIGSGAVKVAAPSAAKPAN